MLDHVGFAVSDYERSKAFYEHALAPLGLTLIMEPAGQAAGFGTAGKPWFWVEAQGTPVRGRLHIALAAPHGDYDFRPVPFRRRVRHWKQVGEDRSVQVGHSFQLVLRDDRVVHSLHRGRDQSRSPFDELIFAEYNIARNFKDFNFRAISDRCQSIHSGPDNLSLICD